MSEKRKQEYEKKLGEEFGTVLYEVENDWLTGLVRLKEYRVLFNEDAVKLLNAVGGAFMWDVQQIFWQDLLLHVTRLTDPARMQNHENLSVQALPAFCEQPALQEKYPKLHPIVEARVKEAVAAAEAPRDWRNRRISHTDRNLAIDPEAKALTPTSLAVVQAAFDAVHAVIDAIVSPVFKWSIENDVMVTPRAEAFLTYLKQLVAAVQYVDGIIDPTGDRKITDVKVAKSFAALNGRELEWKEIHQVIELREAARRFR